MQNCGSIINKQFINHIYKIIVIHWISYLPFEQPGPDLLRLGDALRLSHPGDGGLGETLGVTQEFHTIPLLNLLIAADSLLYECGWSYKEKTLSIKSHG